MTRHIFVDLDGVMADFEKGYEIMYGHHPHTKNDRDMWKTINSNPDHWDSLPIMPGAMILWAAIERYNPTVLTGCPSGGYKAAAEGKRGWCARELGVGVPVITCFSRDKQKHMINPGDILIDDMKKNCDRWTEAGGIAIQHTNAVSTIARLNEILEQE